MRRRIAPYVIALGVDLLWVAVALTGRQITPGLVGVIATPAALTLLIVPLTQRTWQSLPSEDAFRIRVRSAAWRPAMLAALSGIVLVFLPSWFLYRGGVVEGASLLLLVAFLICLAGMAVVGAFLAGQRVNKTAADDR